MDPKKNIRLDRLLSNLGYGSRKDVKAIIRKGKVRIGDHKLLDEKTSIAPEQIGEGSITVMNEPLDPISPFTIMLHKPAGYTCSHDDLGDLIYDLLPHRFSNRKPAFSSIGRLDKDSSGLLLMSDDGELLHKIISPKSEIKKYYQLTLRDPLKGNEQERFNDHSFSIDKNAKPLKPVTFTPSDTHHGSIILTEGKHRQIRRMFEKLGNEVTSLHRNQIGGLTLGTLKEGEWRQLEEREIALVLGKT